MESHKHIISTTESLQDNHRQTAADVEVKCAQPAAAPAIG